jgi:hypothetical protein
MYRSDLGSASLPRLTQILVDHMTWQFTSDSVWMANLTFHGAALLHSDDVELDSALTLQDLLAEINDRKG